MNKDIILKCWISYFNPTVYLLYELSAKNSFKKLLGTNGPALQPPPPPLPTTAILYQSRYSFKIRDT